MEAFTVGGLVNQKRLESEMSLRKTAALLDIAPMYLSNIEHDKQTPQSGDLVPRLSKFLGMTEAQYQSIAAETLKSIAQKEEGEDSYSPFLRERLAAARSIRAANLTKDDLDQIWAILNRAQGDSD